MDASNRDYRHALGHFATGIAVVSGLVDAARSCGITINSFSSVSLEPRIILFSLLNRSSALPCFQPGRPFAISVLGKHHEALSRHFASPGPERWQGVVHASSARGCPVLGDALAVFEGVVDSVQEVGDHVVVFGQVEGVVSRPGTEPLLFFRGAYESVARDANAVPAIAA